MLLSFALIFLTLSTQVADTRAAETKTPLLSLSILHRYGRFKPGFYMSTDIAALLAGIAG